MVLRLGQLVDVVAVWGIWREEERDSLNMQSAARAVRKAWRR